MQKAKRRGSPPRRPRVWSIAGLALLFELAFDRVAVALRAGARGLAFSLLGPGLGRLLRLLLGLFLLVHDLADLRRGCPECLGRRLDALDVVRLEGIA